MCRSILIGAVVTMCSGLSADLPWRTVVFKDGIDALSAELANASGVIEMSGRVHGGWTAWETLTIENEQDPGLTESNLILFPVPVMEIRVRGRRDFTIHPIRISRDPTRYLVASHMTSGAPVLAPKILTRRDWGADESLLLKRETHNGETAAEEKANESPAESAPANRIADCEEAQRNFPAEFRMVKTDSKGPNGEELLWPRAYMKEVKLLVVHHTAMKVTGEERSGVERVRALYAYHAENRGWGDIGYHYLIDEEGQIYQGRSGGAFVVGGHMYCGNVGTIGVALLGNFELEQPTQNQMKSLQWLLDDLTNLYEIDLGRTVTYHGRQFPAIVGHRDLVSTDCPGYYVAETLGQIRRNVITGNLDAAVRFPVVAKKSEEKKNITEKNGQAPKRQSGMSRRIATLTRKIRTYDRITNRPGRTYSLPTENRREVSRPLQKTSAKKSSLQYSGEKNLTNIRIRLDTIDRKYASCGEVDIPKISLQYRGRLTCQMLDSKPALINILSLEEYLMGLSEEPDGEPFEKQKAFAIAARSYAAYYIDRAHRKFPERPYDGSDDPSLFQAYAGKKFEERNPSWVKATEETEGLVLSKDGEIVKAPYFSSSDGRTRSPLEVGWTGFPFAEIFQSKPDPWCLGMELSGHGVGMSGCGAEAQAREGKNTEEILEYYYPKTTILDIERTYP